MKFFTVLLSFFLAGLISSLQAESIKRPKRAAVLKNSWSKSEANNNWDVIWSHLFNPSNNSSEISIWPETGMADPWTPMSGSNSDFDETIWRHRPEPLQDSQFNSAIDLELPNHHRILSPADHLNPKLQGKTNGILSKYPAGWEPRGISSKATRWIVQFENGKPMERPSPYPILVTWGSAESSRGPRYVGKLPEEVQPWSQTIYLKSDVCLKERLRIIGEYQPGNVSTGIYDFELEVHNSCQNWFNFEALIKTRNPFKPGKTWMYVGRLEVPPNQTHGIRFYADAETLHVRSGSLLFVNAFEGNGSMELGGDATEKRAYEHFPRLMSRNPVGQKNWTRDDEFMDDLERLKDTIRAISADNTEAFDSGDEEFEEIIRAKIEELNGN